MSKNRHILSRIIDCVKFCGAFELALRGHDESESSDNPGVFPGLVDFVSSLDERRAKFMFKKETELKKHQLNHKKNLTELHKADIHVYF